MNPKRVIMVYDCMHLLTCVLLNNIYTKLLETVEGDPLRCLMPINNFIVKLK